MCKIIEMGFLIKSLLLMAVFAMALAVAGPALAANEVKVILDGRALNFDVPPQMVNGRTLVPLRVIFEELGASVDWNENTQTITATKGNTTVSLRIGNNVLTRNSTSVTLDVPAQLINKRTMVPTRAVAEAFGADVKWDSVAQTVFITNNTTTYTPPVNNTTDTTTNTTTNTGLDNANNGEYTEIISYYRELKLGGHDKDEAIENLVNSVAQKLGISDEQKLYELRNSAFEAYDANNLGYALNDINRDGSPELFFIIDEYYDFSDSIYAIYTLRNGSPVLVGGYWSRNWCALDITGIIYKHGSNGAADSTSATYNLDSNSGELQIIRQVELSEFPDNHTKGLVFISLS